MSGSDEDFEMILVANKKLGDENQQLKEKIKQLEGVCGIMHDEATNRFYKPVKDGNNPTHKDCLNCGARARLIYTVIGKKYYGTDCMFCHYTIWFDLWKKEDL